MANKIDETRRNKFGNMIIGSWNKNSNDFEWFMCWCTKVPGREGQMTPVFTADRREAMQFVYADKAKSVIAQIKETWPEMKLFDAPAVWAMCDTGRRLIRAIFGEMPEEEAESITTICRIHAGRCSRKKDTAFALQTDRSRMGRMTKSILISADARAQDERKGTSKCSEEQLNCLTGM